MNEERNEYNKELDVKIIEYMHWGATYGGYHAKNTVPKQVSRNSWVRKEFLGEKGRESGE